MEYKDTNTDARATPADPFRIVYILMIVLGVGILTPFNAVVRLVSRVCNGIAFNNENSSIISTKILHPKFKNFIRHHTIVAVLATSTPM